jgi:hypothetical protein
MPAFRVFQYTLVAHADAEADIARRVEQGHERSVTAQEILVAVVGRVLRLTARVPCPASRSGWTYRREAKCSGLRAEAQRD